MKRPVELTADIVRFKNGEESWIAFVGIYNDRPYEIFTGKLEEDAMFIPKKVTKGVILKVKDADGNKRYDFQYTDKYGYTNTIGGISRLFDEEFWNYAKLISGVLRNGMPILDVVTLIESAAPEHREYQYLEKRCGPCAQTVYSRRNQSEGEVPELRPGDAGLPE